MFFKFTKTFLQKNHLLYLQPHFTIMITTIDVGNSRIKVAVFEQNKLLQKFVFETDIFESALKNILNTYPSVQKIIVSSVGAPTIIDFLSFIAPKKLVFISHETQFPFENVYQTPKTLGIDRMVLAAGAVLAFPAQNRLVIDAGTCVTYDYINQKNQYLGGAISPGLRLRYGALNNYTANLPLLETHSPEKMVGDSTQNAIHSGVVNGLIHEINGFIADFEAHNHNFIIILTGGDAIFLAKRLKNTIFANSNFLLESLNFIYIYNSKND